MHSHCQNKIGDKGGKRFQGKTLFHTLPPLPHAHYYILCSCRCSLYIVLYLRSSKYVGHNTQTGSIQGHHINTPNKTIKRPWGTLTMEGSTGTYDIIKTPFCRSLYCSGNPPFRFQLQRPHFYFF